jgi:hypothetical protein
MATIYTNFVFGAEAESIVTWNRQLSAEELASLQAKKGALMAAGKFGSFSSDSTYQWTTADVANEWVAFCNTFTPPPTLATVELLTEPVTP